MPSVMASTSSMMPCTGRSDGAGQPVAHQRRRATRMTGAMSSIERSSSAGPNATCSVERGDEQPADLGAGAARPAAAR